MLDFHVVPPEAVGSPGKYVTASIPDEASYAFFARYFAGAELHPKRPNFLGFWGGTDVSGYQLVRLSQVMADALSDLSCRPPRFRVLCGWSSYPISEATEKWADVDRDALVEIARELIAVIDLARSTTDQMEAMGD